MKLTRCVMASALLASVCLVTSAGQEPGPSAQARLHGTFMKLAKAKSVQMEFADTSFALTDSHLALLGELADLIHL